MNKNAAIANEKEIEKIKENIILPLEENSYYNLGKNDALDTVIAHCLNKYGLNAKQIQTVFNTLVRILDERADLANDKKVAELDKLIAEIGE